MGTLTTAEVETAVQRAVAQHQHQPGNLLNVLHRVQERLGFIPPEAVAMIAQRLNLSRADVHGVVSFYHYFRTVPPGRHTLYLCRAEACQSMHGRALEHHAKERLGVDFHQTTGDGAFSLEPVYCLGNCALSPAVMIDGELFGRVTPARFDALLAERGGRA